MSAAYQNNDPNAKFLKKAKIVKRRVYISVCEKVMVIEHQLVQAKIRVIKLL